MNDVAALRAVSNAPEEDTLPHNIEAEQQLLGAILTNNDIYDRIAALVKAEHFFEPVHARIFEIAVARIQKNALASPVTLKAYLEEDEGLKELGGPAYLARLAGSAISAFAARDYAQMIYDLAVRRELMSLGATFPTGRGGSRSTATPRTRSPRPSSGFTRWPSRGRWKRGSCRS